MEGIGSEYDDNPERPELPDSGGHFKANTQGDRAGESDAIPLIPSDQDPLSARPEPYDAEAVPEVSAPDTEAEALEAGEPLLPDTELPSEAEVLRETARDIRDHITAHIAKVTERALTLPPDMPQPVDQTVPLGLEQFTQPGQSLGECTNAARRLDQRSVRSYAEYTDEIERRYLSMNPDGTPLFGFGLHMRYADVRGAADIILQNRGEARIEFQAADGDTKAYLFKPVRLPVGRVLRRTPVVIGSDVGETRGSAPAPELMYTAAAERRENESFDNEIRDLTQEAVHFVGKEEAAYLDAIISAAKPVTIQALGDLVERRLKNEQEPDSLHAAWAASELEQTVLRHSQRFGPEAVERIYPDQMYVRVQAVPASEAGPAQIIANFKNDVSTDVFTEWLGRPMVSGDVYSVTITHTVSARNNKVVVDSALRAVNELGQEAVPEQQYTYDYGDITDVSIFKQWLYRLQ